MYKPNSVYLERPRNRKYVTLYMNNLLHSEAKQRLIIARPLSIFARTRLHNVQLRPIVIRYTFQDSLRDFLAMLFVWCSRPRQTKDVKI